MTYNRHTTLPCPISVWAYVPMISKFSAFRSHAICSGEVWLRRAGRNISLCKFMGEASFGNNALKTISTNHVIHFLERKMLDLLFHYFVKAASFWQDNVNHRGERKKKITREGTRGRQYSAPSPPPPPITQRKTELNTASVNLCIVSNCSMTNCF